jgi:hypothetical protein
VMARITSSGCIPAWRKVRRLDTEVCPHRNTNSRLLRQTTCILPHSPFAKWLDCYRVSFGDFPRTSA